LSAARLALAWRVLRGEGAAAVRDRVLDRLAEARRRRGYRLLRRHPASTTASPGRVHRPAPGFPVLNLLATPPAPWLGGVQVQLGERLAAESSRRPVALLYPDRARRGVRLEMRRAGRRWREEWPARSSVAATTLADDELADAIAGALAVTGARALHVEGLAGLPLATLLDLAHDGLPLVLSLHDFAAFCPRPNLLEAPHGAFCEYSRNRRRCARCLAVDWPVAAGFQEARRELAARLLAAARLLVFPSEFLRRTYGELFPGLDPSRQAVVAPGRPAPPRPPRRGRRGGPLRVAVVGGARAVKGLAVLRQVIAATAGRPLRWIVFGGGEPAAAAALRRMPGVEVRGYYRSGRLPRLLERHEVDVGLLLSPAPETYGLALDELAAAGVPTVAFDLGALGERSRQLAAGRLVDPRDGAAGVVRALDEIRDHPPPRPLPPPRTADAARRMLALYADAGIL
jgi:glycosyltransferase involved in cell wall biosynthesis